MPLILLGGCTGSGKTEVLSELQRQQQQVLDLEALCGHCGSVFGHLPFRQKVTSYQFQKRLQARWARFDQTAPVFAECKPPIIGHLKMPSWLMRELEAAQVIWLDVPKKIRLRQLIKVYGGAGVYEFTAALLRLEKKLPADILQQVQCLYAQGEISPAFALLMDYFDRAPLYSRAGRAHVIADIQVEEFLPEQIAREVSMIVQWTNDLRAPYTFPS